MIKLTLEGTVDDVEDFLFDIDDMKDFILELRDEMRDSILNLSHTIDSSLAPVSVPQPDQQQDRIYRKLEERLKEKKKDSVSPGSKIIDHDPDRTHELRKNDRVKEILEKTKPAVSVHKAPDGTDRARDRKTELPTEGDLLIPAFKYDMSHEKVYGPLTICELPDGRVVLRYMSSRVFTTREKVLSIPHPIPVGYLNNMKLASNPRTAIRHYRDYLAAGVSVSPGKEITAQDPDRNEGKDPDAMFKPMLRGAFSTRPGKEDIDKIEGSLEK